MTAWWHLNIIPLADKLLWDMILRCLTRLNMAVRLNRNLLRLRQILKLGSKNMAAGTGGCFYWVMGAAFWANLHNAESLLFLSVTRQLNAVAQAHAFLHLFGKAGTLD